MKKFTHFVSSTIILVIFCSACSSVTVLKEPEKSNSYDFDKVLIVAMTTDYNLRSMIEKELSYAMRQKGYHMFSSVNVDESKKELYTRDELILLAEEKSLDGVIIVRLKDMTSKERYSSDRNINDPYSMNNYFFYTTSFTGVYNWSYEPEKTVTVETALFDAKEKTMIYQADAIYKNSSSMEEGAAAFAKIFAKAYDSSGLLKKKE